MSIPTLPPSAPRVRLSIVSGSGAGGHVEVSRPVTFIGKRPGCKIALNHPQVYPLHAVIVHTGHEVYVRDLTGKEATFHNELKAVCERLTNGDAIRIAGWELRVDIASAPLQPGSAAQAEEAGPEIVGFERIDNGKFYKLTRPVFVVGRRPTCDAVLPDREVSRVHALFFKYLECMTVCDALSKNGLLLNDQPVQFARLRSGDVLGIEDFRLKMGSSVSAAEAVAPPTAVAKPAEPSAALGDDDVLDLLMERKPNHVDIHTPE
ncbi:MAG TPA: FHA domain-containing protein [Phycisphaerae bacterium]|jgi:pSer/pThr/pTyr-binding forkhead associated (FHA) protein